MEKQFKKKSIKNFQIGNSKHYSYDIGNSLELSQLNMKKGKSLNCSR